MAYVAPGAMTFRRTGGDLDKKITDQLALIDTEIDAAELRLTVIEAGRASFIVGALTPGNANAFCFAWQNPLSTSILIHKLVVNVITGGTSGAVLDFGTGSTGTTHADNLIDGGAGDASGILDNITDKGSNGKTSVILPIGGYVTGQILTQNAAALAGTVTFIYTLL